MINKQDVQNAMHTMLGRAAVVGLFGLACAVAVAAIAGLAWLVANQFLTGITACVVLALLFWFAIELHLARSSRKFKEWCATRDRVLKERNQK